MNSPATAPDFVEHSTAVDPRAGFHPVTVYFGSDDTARELMVSDLVNLERALSDPARYPLIFDEDPEGANGGIRSCLVTDWQVGWDESDEPDEPDSPTLTGLIKELAVQSAERGHRNTSWTLLAIVFVITAGMSIASGLMLNQWALGLGGWPTRAIAVFLLIYAGMMVGMVIARFLR